MALRKTSLVLLRNFLSSPSDHLLSARLTAATCRLSYPCPRGFSHDTAREESSALDATGQSTYKGPLARTLTNLKAFSLASCVASVASAPVIVFMSAGSAVGAKVGLASLMSGFSALTTGLLHWLTGPYVHALEYTPATQQLRIRTLSVLCRPVDTRVHLAEVAYPADTLRPQVTFKAGGRYFYIDADAFRDKELLAKLSPPDPLPGTSK